MLTIVCTETHIENLKHFYFIVVILTPVQLEKFCKGNLCHEEIETNELFYYHLSAFIPWFGWFGLV